MKIFIAEYGEGPGVRLRKGFKHDVSHLHTLWDREGPAMRLAGTLQVKKVAAGLVCRRGGAELGAVAIVDGALDLRPPLPHVTLNPDRLVPAELQEWLDLVAKDASPLSSATGLGLERD